MAIDRRAPQPTGGGAGMGRCVDAERRPPPEPLPLGEGDERGWGKTFTAGAQRPPYCFRRWMAEAYAGTGWPLRYFRRDANPPQWTWGVSGPIPAATMAAEYRVMDAQAKSSGHRNRHDGHSRRAGCCSGTCRIRRDLGVCAAVALTQAVVGRVFVCPPGSSWVCSSLQIVA